MSDKTPYSSDNIEPVLLYGTKYRQAVFDFLSMLVPANMMKEILVVERAIELAGENSPWGAILVRDARYVLGAVIWTCSADTLTIERYSTLSNGGFLGLLLCEAMAQAFKVGHGKDFYVAYLDNCMDDYKIGAYRKNDFNLLGHEVAEADRIQGRQQVDDCIPPLNLKVRRGKIVSKKLQFYICELDEKPVDRVAIYNVQDGCISGNVILWALHVEGVEPEKAKYYGYCRLLS